MKFAKTLEHERQQEWFDFYVDYKLMKKALKQPEPEAASMTFCGLLDSELAKVCEFMRGQQRAIRADMQPLELREEPREGAGGLLELLPADREAEALHEQCGLLVQHIENFRSYAALNQTALRKIIKKFDKRFHANCHEAFDMPQGSATLPLGERDIAKWLLAPATRCLQLVRCVVNSAPTPRQFDFWLEELRVGIELADRRVGGASALGPTPVRLQLCNESEDCRCTIRNTFINLEVPEDDDEFVRPLRRSNSQPSLRRTSNAASATVEPTREGGPAEENEEEPEGPRLDFLAGAPFALGGTGGGFCMPPGNFIAAFAARLGQQDAHPLPEGSYFFHEQVGGTRQKSVSSLGADPPSTPSTSAPSSSSGRAGGSPFRHGLPPPLEAPAEFASPSPDGPCSASAPVAGGGGAASSRRKGVAAEDTGAGAPPASAWWRAVREVCPLSGFPVSLLPYPPFKFQMGRGRAPKLVDGVYLVLQVISSWNFDVLGRALTPADISSVDAHMKRCKLGPFRISAATKLLAEGTPPSHEKFLRLRADAHRRLVGLSNIKRLRLERGDAGACPPPPPRLDPSPRRRSSPSRRASSAARRAAAAANSAQHPAAAAFRPQPGSQSAHFPPGARSVADGARGAAAPCAPPMLSRQPRSQGSQPRFENLGARAAAGTAAASAAEPRQVSVPAPCFVGPLTQPWPPSALVGDLLRATQFAPAGAVVAGALTGASVVGTHPGW